MQKNLLQLFQEFLYESEFIKKVRPGTLRSYSNSFALFTKLIPDCSLDSLSSGSITRFFKILQERKRIVGKGVVKTGIKKSTVVTYSRKLSIFFQWLEINKYIPQNPFTEIRLPSPSYEDKKYLKKYEIEKIVTAIHSNQNNNILIFKRNLVVFFLFLFCGLRREELCQLQIRDIDFQKRILTIRADISKSQLKREIPLHSTLIMHIKDYLIQRKKYTTQHLIVSSTSDAMLTSDGLKHLIDKLRIQSGIPFHVHQLRHTFAVNFLKTSNNIVKLKQLLGHKSIAMTSVYLRCLPVDYLRSDIENMNIDSMI